MPYIPRDLEETLEKYGHRGEIIAIQGPRQAGKTTLLKHIYDGMTEPKAFVNLDLPEERRALSKKPPHVSPQTPARREGNTVPRRGAER